MRVRAHAKVNLFLRVLGRRPDGYHELETIFHGVAFGDDIEVRTTSTDRVEVRMTPVEGVVGVLPAARDNLVWHAAQRLIQLGGRTEGVEIRVLKRIPLGAGLGGGSADAAGALVALNDLWRMQLDATDLMKVAASIGSDVPYFLVGGTALAAARGEEVVPLSHTATMWFVLAMSHEPLLTGEVYRMWDKHGSVGRVPAEPMIAALAAGYLSDVASLVHNDLEAPAFRLRPELEKKRTLLTEAGALASCVAGSGPTLFAIARDEAHAHDIADATKEEFDRVVVARSQHECIERLP